MHRSVLCDRLPKTRAPPLTALLHIAYLSARDICVGFASFAAEPHRIGLLTIVPLEGERAEVLIVEALYRVRAGHD